MMHKNRKQQWQRREIAGEMVLLVPYTLLLVLRLEGRPARMGVPWPRAVASTFGKMMVKEPMLHRIASMLLHTK